MITFIAAMFTGCEDIEQRILDSIDTCDALSFAAEETFKTTDATQIQVLEGEFRIFYPENEDEVYQLDEIVDNPDVSDCATHYFAANYED